MSDRIKDPAEIGPRIIENVCRVIAGKRSVIEKAAAAVLAGSHIIFEDVPGVGKTVLCKALASSINAQFSRIQCTPDLLPSDILGAAVYHQNTNEFVFNKGPVFCNILLADEINRAAPKTQSALLECMEERQATISGSSYRLPDPFIVIATQNPIEYEGTFPLPEAQLDRFGVKLRLGYPDQDSEVKFLQEQRLSHPLESIKPVCTIEELRSAMAEARQTAADDSVCRYIVRLTNASRKDSRLILGAGPRASQALYRLSQALAYLRGRRYIIPDDVQEMAESVMAHRFVMSADGSLTAEEIVRDLLERTEIE